MDFVYRIFMGTGHLLGHLLDITLERPRGVAAGPFGVGTNQGSSEVYL
jgi:hypothetical protein